MPRYPNGQYPEWLFVSLGSGWNAVDGNWRWLLPPATAAKVRRLIQIGKDRKGRTLRITSGWACYRPLHIQVIARRIYGRGAAEVGKSSHGMTWAGRITNWRLVDTAAIDFANRREVWPSEKEWIAACAEVGLHAMQIVPPDWPYEDWHVIDLDPWGAVPAFDGASNFEPGTAPDPKEWDEMATKEEIKAAIAEVVAGLVNTASAVRVFEVIRGDGSVQAYIGAPGQTSVHITNPTDRDVLERYLRGVAGGGRDRFNSAEKNIIDKYLPLLDA